MFCDKIKSEKYESQKKKKQEQSKILYVSVLTSEG